MKHLEVLSVHCHSSIEPYLSFKSALKELTIYAVIRSRKKDFEDWMTNGFNLPNVNIILHSSSMDSTVMMFMDVLVSNWSEWNSQISAGHIASLKVYIDYKVPLNLFQNAPVFQLQYGELSALPFVIAMTNDWFMLTDHGDINDSRIVHKAKY